jgi:hypothetical protein
VSSPPLTVLMPVYNAAPHLRQALDSVLAQSYRDYELLAIDDGSSDGSREILRTCSDPRLRLVEHSRNLGLTASLNEGLVLARGALVARQDADDVSRPERFERQVGFLRAHPEVALVGSQAAVIDAAGRRLGSLEKPCEATALRFELLFDNGFVHSAVMFRRSVVRDELGGYDASYRYCQDFALWSRLVRSRAAANLPQTLLSNREHAGSMTLSSLEANRLESRRVLAGNLAAEFGSDVSEADVAVAVELREGLRPGAAPRFLGVFERLLSLFETRHADARASRDFRRTVARQYARLFMAARLAAPGVTALVLARRFRGYPVWGCCWRALRTALRSRWRAASVL